MTDHSLLRSGKRFRQGRWDEIPKWQLRVLMPGFVAAFAVREFFRDRAQNLSASLAFTTVLSLVPLLSVVTSVLAMTGAFDASNGGLLDFIEPVFPSSAQKAAIYLQEFAQSSAAGVGGVSALAFLFISIFLFIDIERTFNAVWHAEDRRPIFSKLLTFYFVVTFGPILVTTSVGLTARAQLVLSRFGLETGFFGTVAPFLIALLLFTVLHWALPGIRVRWTAALVGGVFTAVAFELAKFGFNLYVTHVVLESYTTIYGALGLIPIFLLWVYVSWIVVLLGAELAYTVQNLRMIIEVDAAQMRDPAKQKTNIYNPLVGIEVLAPIARQFKAGKGSLPENDLIRGLGYSEFFLREVIADLERLGVIKAVEDPQTNERAVIPAKQLDDIELLEVARSFYDLAEPNSLPMEELQSEIHRVTLAQLEGKSALALVDMPRRALLPIPTDEVPALLGSQVPMSAHASQATPPEPDLGDTPAIDAAPEVLEAVDERVTTSGDVADLPGLPGLQIVVDPDDDPTKVEAVAEALAQADVADAGIDLGEDWDDFDPSSVAEDVPANELKATAEMDVELEALLRLKDD